MMQANTSRVKKLAANVIANMRAEGFHVSDATAKKCERILAGKASADELVAEALSAYGKKSK